GLRGRLVAHILDYTTGHSLLQALVITIARPFTRPTMHLNCGITIRGRAYRDSSSTACRFRTCKRLDGRREARPVASGQPRLERVDDGMPPPALLGDPALP